jgi:iron only hydrogenase large subunit-like protein/uncharacterized Fe-S cluster-containing protein
MHNGQAYVDEARCIACGTCIRECPQKAKTFRNDVAEVKRLLAGGGKIAVSIAPSYVAVYNDWQVKRLPSALRKLGFTYVGHTSLGAYHLACSSVALMKDCNTQNGYIATACPAVVNYVEKYQPQLISKLLPLVSPMVAHGMILKKKLGNDAKIVFIGPCVAKKTELEVVQNNKAVDVVLTFKELGELLESCDIELATCAESDFDEQPAGSAQLFPLSGGMLKTAGFETDFLNLDVLAVTGFDNLKQSLAFSTENGNQNCFIEPLFCPEGCINGPGIDSEKNVFERKRDVVEFTNRKNAFQPLQSYPYSLFAAEYKNRSDFNQKIILEEEIVKVLEQTGKADSKQQLNCGACGYSTCRQKAIAVIQGMAEPEICIPHMRRLAELRVDRILQKSPNGIVILDDKLNIISINPAFMKFFVCSNAILGRNISYLMDPSAFEKLAEGAVDNLETALSFSSYNLVCQALFYALREERQFVGIFVDITNLKVNEQKLEQIKLQTITQARELLEHQMKTAQGIAKFLGETTARGEELIEKLMSLSDNDEPQRN